MTIALSRFANGDTNYIGKHNGNADTLEGAVNALQSQVGSQISSLTAGNAAEASFGAQNTLIGEGSYAPSGAGTDLTVAAGYFWHFGTQSVRRKLTSTVLSFSGLTAATYYVVVDALGEPARSDSATDACYSVVWDGAAFGAVTRLVPIAWGYNTFNDAKTSTALGAQVYQSLDTRLEAGESAQTALVSKTITTADVTLTIAEGMQAIAVRCTGAMTADRALIVPAYKKPYLIIADTTGGFLLTVKTASGSGVALANGQRAVVYCDGVNVLEVLLGPSTGGAPSGELPVADTTAIVKGSADATKKIRFEVDGLTTATTRVLTVPDADMTLGDNAYLVGAMYNGAPTASLVLLHHVVTRAVVFPQDLAGSRGAAGVAATAQTDFDIQKNGASAGTMRFAAAATTATFIMASATTFAAGDVLKVLAPATPDSTLADITFTLAGTR